MRVQACVRPCMRACAGVRAQVCVRSCAGVPNPNEVSERSAEHWLAYSEQFHYAHVTTFGSFDEVSTRVTRVGWAQPCS